MSDYAELVKMLRTCSERDSCMADLACPYLGTGLCDDKAGKAADAIEELGNWWKMYGALAEMVKTDSVKNATPKTNADRIRAMSDEELAKVIACPYVICREELGTDCDLCALNWLQKEASL